MQATSETQNGAATYDRSKFARMMEEAGIGATNGSDPPHREWPEIIPARRFVAEPLDRPKQLVEGLLHQGEKIVLGGSSKTNKTWACVDFATSVASGSPWWGFTTHKAAVLYVNLEIQPFHMQQRIRVICDAKQIGIPGNLDVWNLRGYACDVDLLVGKILGKAEGNRYALIIIDPIYKALGDRDENAAGDIASLCNRLELLSVSTGAAVMFAAHFSKGNQAAKSSIDRIGGSGVWARDADTILTVTPHAEEQTYVVESTVRNFVSVAPFGVRWKYPLMVRADDVDATKLKTGRTPQFNVDQLLQALPPEGLTSGEWQKKVMATTRMSETSFKTFCRKLKAMNKVESVSGKYRPVPDWDSAAVA